MAYVRLVKGRRKTAPKALLYRNASHSVSRIWMKGGWVLVRAFARAMMGIIIL